jgi:hypothetical protein
VAGLHPGGRVFLAGVVVSYQKLSPKCRRHHRAKRAPGWKVEQPQPGVTRWTLPNGRTHTTNPTIYGN